jgi:hypothetical protein
VIVILAAAFAFVVLSKKPKSSSYSRSIDEEIVLSPTQYATGLTDVFTMGSSEKFESCDRSGLLDDDPA